MLEKNFLNANDVATFMGISIPMAYKVIRRLNDELRQKGYITISGKISRTYFEEKIYSHSAQEDKNMPAYKDEKRNTWLVMFRYKDWTGKTKSKTKRGFATKREAVADGSGMNESRP